MSNKVELYEQRGLLVRLAFKNAHHFLRDYAVYFLTLILGITMFYAAISINDQLGVLQLTQDQRSYMRAMAMLLRICSVVVLLTLIYLIVYSNSFILRRRKSEFALYLTLGMENKQIVYIILIENATCALASLLVGLLCGILFTQLLIVGMQQYLAVEITQFTLMVSPASCLITILAFTSIFIISMVRSMLTVVRKSLLELLSADHAHQRLIASKSLKSRGKLLVFVVALVLIIASYVVLSTQGFKDQSMFLLATLMVFTGTVLLFYSLARFTVGFARTNKRLYYRGLTMFITRQLASRINSAWVSLVVATVLLFLGLCGFFVGTGVIGYFNRTLTEGMPFDVNMYSRVTPAAPSELVKDVPVNLDLHPGANHLTSWIDYMQSHYPYYDQEIDYGLSYFVYNELRFGESPSDITSVDAEQNQSYADTNFTITTNVFKRTDAELARMPADIQTIHEDAIMNNASSETVVNFIKLSDYNNVLKALKKDPLVLEQSQVAVWTMSSAPTNLKDYFSYLAKEQLSVTIDDTTYQVLDRTLDDAIGPSLFYFALVVPDELLTHPVQAYCLGMFMLKTGIDTKVAYQHLDDFTETVQDTYSHIQTRSQLADIYKSLTLSIMYVALYLGVIILIVCAAVISLQQLTTISDNIKRYRLLQELGADQRQIKHALRAQVGIYFLLPLLVASVHGAVALMVINRILIDALGLDLVAGLGVTILFALIIYGGYFLITYMMCKRMVFQENYV